MYIQRYLIPNFVEIQRQSFFHFLEKGIIEEFNIRNPITNAKKDLEIFFYPEYYRLSIPKYNPQEAIFKNKSYVSKLYVPVQLTDKRRKCIYLKWMLICHLPLMTKHGHFILNGAARVIVNQIVRSPGVYFQEKMHEVYIHKWNDKPDIIVKRYFADLICLKGTWLRFEIDKDKLIWAQMKRGPKIPVLWLLLAMGLTEKGIFSSMDSPSRLFSNFSATKNYTYVQNPIQAWKQLYLLFNTEKVRLPKNLAELGRRWLFKKFMNPRTYDLGKQGRFAFNQKFGLNLSLNQRTLTAQDLICVVDYLMKVEKGVYGTDDIDHLKNKRVRSSGDLIQAQFALGLLRLEKQIRDRFHETNNALSSSSFSLKSSLQQKGKGKGQNPLLLRQQKGTPNLHFLINTRPVNGAFKEFFGTNPLSQFMDQINPLSEITHKRRLSSMGPGGVTRDTATLSIRGIHPSHYGRICPIETPEGKNTGLVNSLTVYARIDDQGLLKTPFYKIYKGQVQKKSGMIYLSADQEEKTVVAAADVFVSKSAFLPTEPIPVRIGKEFTMRSRSEVHYIGISPIQMISVATSLIPFLEHDDANRALMGSNMQRQAVPLIRPERPIVGTGLEARAVSDSGHALTSKASGFVAYASGSKIRIYTTP